MISESSCNAYRTWWNENSEKQTRENRMSLVAVHKERLDGHVNRNMVFTRRGVGSEHKGVQSSHRLEGAHGTASSETLWGGKQRRWQLRKKEGEKFNRNGGMEECRKGGREGEGSIQ